MDSDHVTRDHVEALRGNPSLLVSNVEPNHQEVPPKKGSLATIGNETLYIAGHGNTNRLSGIPPERLAKYLVAMGLTTEYGGKIVLVSCFTGLPTKEDDLSTSYAGRLQSSLADIGIRVPVSAPLGGAKVTRERSLDRSQAYNIRSIYPGLEDEYRKVSEEMEVGFKEEIRKLNKARTEQFEESRPIGDKLMVVDRRLKAYRKVEASLREALAQLENQSVQLKKLISSTTGSEEEVQSVVQEIGERLRLIAIEQGGLEDELKEHLESPDYQVDLELESEYRHQLVQSLKVSKQFDARIDELKERFNEQTERLAKKYFMPMDKGMSDLPRPDKPCFLTTACVVARGLPDDCHELTLLRRFRDQDLRDLPGGPKLIDEYYALAPAILAAIHSRPDARRCLDALYTELVLPTVGRLEAGDGPGALEHYRRVVLALRRRYVDE